MYLAKNYTDPVSYTHLMPQVEKMLPKLDSILASLNVILADPAIPEMCIRDRFYMHAIQWHGLYVQLAHRFLQ